jgi:hypothetical protein
MPWSVHRDDGALHVRITPPVGDWEALMDAIDENLDPMPPSVHMPTSFGSASAIDQELLDLLRASMRSRGACLA